MATDVTVLGSDGSTISIPISSDVNAQLAQQALGPLNQLISTGELSLFNATITGAITIPAGSGSVSGVEVTVPGVTFMDTLPGNNKFLYVTGGNNTVAAIGSTDPTVVSGDGSTLVYYNNSADAQIFLGGGENYIAENVSTSGAVINVDGSDTFGVGGAVIDAHQGSTTVNLFNNSANAIEGGGNILINAQSGTELLALTGSPDVPVTITGSADSTLWLVNQASAFIEPGAGNILIMPGSTGSATLFGGTGSFGGATISAADFTGSATVMGGTGYYQGGSAGNNFLLSSTVSGATTLIGGGNNDILASFASDNTLFGGLGNEVLIGANTSGTGNDFISGSGADTIWGSATGNNTIGFGADSTLAYGQHGTATLGYSGNLYYQAAAGGVDNIGDFLPGTDVFSLTLTASAENVAAVTVTGLQYYAPGSTSPFGTDGTQATLSDGSTINFLHSDVTKSSFS